MRLVPGHSGREPALAAGRALLLDRPRGDAPFPPVRLPRRTLLEERAQALLALVARPPRGDPLRRLRAVGTFAHEALRPPGGLWPGGKQLADDSVDRSVELVRDLVHEADAQRRLGVEALAGDEVAARRAGTDLRKRERRDHRGDDPELHLRERERRVTRRDCDVGRSDEARPAAERMTLYARDDGDEAAVDRLQHPPQRIRIRDVLV